MEVRNCRTCGRLYNYIGGSYRNLCPSCVQKMEDKFQEVKEFIQDNKLATIPEISEACEVSIDQLHRWVREDRLCFSDDSPIGIPCENCGTTIKSGRFCNLCKDKMTTQLNNMYAPDSTVRKKDPRENARMRFLDK